LINENQVLFFFFFYTVQINLSVLSCSGHGRLNAQNYFPDVQVHVLTIVSH